MNKERRNPLQKLVYKIDDYIKEEKENNKTYLKDKENFVGELNSKYKALESKVDDEIKMNDLHESQKVLSNNERLIAIGRMRREIENTGYAFRSHKKKFALNNREKFIDLVNRQKKFIT